MFLLTTATTLTTSAIPQFKMSSNGVLQYTGLGGLFNITYVINCQFSGGSFNAYFQLYLNGTGISGTTTVINMINYTTITTTKAVSLSTNDLISLYFQNPSSSNVPGISVYLYNLNCIGA